jgi:hypothetical protein
VLVMHGQELSPTAVMRSLTDRHRQPHLNLMMLIQIRCAPMAGGGLPVIGAPSHETFGRSRNRRAHSSGSAVAAETVE